MQKILEIRGQKAMHVPIAIEIDLTALYEVETRIFNQAVKRNSESFPEDFIFRLTRKEWCDLRSQFVISNEQLADNQNTNSSQIVMSSKKHRGKCLSN